MRHFWRRWRPSDAWLRIWVAFGVTPEALSWVLIMLLLLLSGPPPQQFTSPASTTSSPCSSTKP